MKYIRSLKELWDYRQMVRRLVRKDLRTRYKGSILGFFWTFLNPLLQLVVYTFVFSVIMRQEAIDNYAMFLFVALVPWIFLSSSLMSGSVSILASKNLVQKIYFPRAVIPLSTTCSSFMNMLFSMIIVFITLLVTGIGIHGVVWTLPVVMLIQFVFVLGLTFIVSGLNVYFRDLEQIVGIGTMAWQFMSPVMYSIDMVPKELHTLFYLNPMTNVVIAYRDILYFHKLPDFSSLIPTVIVAIVTLLLGYIIFQYLQRGFAEEL